MKYEEKILEVLEQIRDKLDPRPVIVTEISRSKDGCFIRNSDGTVTDSQLKLIWYPTLEKKFTWEEAKKECEKIGCRLPTTHELFSLLDLNKYSPAIDKEIFPDTKTDVYYWTGDTCPWDTASARIVDFYNGFVGHNGKDINGYVRPVRSSQ